MATRRALLFAVLSAVVVLANLYFFLNSLLFGAPARHAHVSSAMCAPGHQASLPQENPNKFLFVSCGGFLD